MKLAHGPEGPAHGRVGSSRRVLAGFLALWSAQLVPLPVSKTAAAEAGGAAISPSDATSFSVPYSESRPLDLVYETDLPLWVRAFRELHGEAWLLYWDDLAQTPRYLVPREPYALLAGSTLRPEDGYAGVEAAVRDFVAASGGLFGVSDCELEPAVLHPIAEDLLLVFGQRTRDGIRVRGASLRVYVSTDGRLVSAKAYLLRGASERWQSLGIDPAALLDRDTVAQKASEDGVEVLDARLELVYSIGSAGEVRPAWRLRTVGTGNTVGTGSAVWEQVVDAASGEALGSYPIVKYGARQGNVAVTAPPLDDPFAHPEDSTETQGLGGAVVMDSSGTPRAVSHASGTFQAPIPSTLPVVAALAHAPSVVGCQGAFNRCLDERPPCYDLVVRPDAGEARLCDPGAPRCLSDAAARRRAFQPLDDPAGRGRWERDRRRLQLVAARRRQRGDTDEPERRGSGGRPGAAHGDAGGPRARASCVSQPHRHRGVVFFQSDAFNQDAIRVREIVVRWIVINRAADPQDLAFQDGLRILDELLTTSRQIGALRGEGPGHARRAEIERFLRTAFLDPSFHQGVIFLRGDPNFDGEVDISEPRRAG